MVKLPIPEGALDGTMMSNPTAPGVTTDYISPLAIPTAPQLSPEPAVENGPHTAESQYDYNTENFGVE